MAKFGLRKFSHEATKTLHSTTKILMPKKYFYYPRNEIQGIYTQLHVKI